VWLQLRTAAGAQLTAPELARLQQAARFAGLLHEGLMRLEGCHVSLTPRGFLLADAIGAEVVDMLAQADGQNLGRPSTCSAA
jgi:hypothetical protein